MTRAQTPKDKRLVLDDQHAPQPDLARATADGSFQTPERPDARMHPPHTIVFFLGLRSSQDHARRHPPERRAIPHRGFAMHEPLRPEREQRSITIPGGGEDAYGLARLQPPLDDPAPLDIPQPMITLPNSPSFPLLVHDLPCSDQCRSLHRPCTHPDAPGRSVRVVELDLRSSELCCSLRLQRAFSDQLDPDAQPTPYFPERSGSQPFHSARKKQNSD